MKRKFVNRQRLEEIIPLSTPMLVFIEPTNMCNFKCKFCPTGDEKLLNKVNRQCGVMKLDTLKKIVDGFKEFPEKIKKLHFYLNGEPLINKEICEMISYAKNKEISEEIWLKTNGSLLNKELSEQLIDSGLDLIGISIEGVSNERYKQICGVNIDYNKILEDIRYLYNHKGKCKIYVKIVDYGLTTYEKEKFFNDFSEISTEIQIENLMGWSMSSEKDFTLGMSSEKTPENEELVNKDICPYPFYTMALNFNGDVSLCCVDWSLNTVVGNINEQSLMEIWNGERLYDFRKMHLEKKRFNNSACGDCYSIKCNPDNIDEYAEKILKKLAENRGNL